MKELLTYIVQNLVDHPDEVSVTERKSTYSGETIYEVRVADGDMGKVIGKRGKIANAIRTVVKATATKDNKRVIVNIVSDAE